MKAAWLPGISTIVASIRRAMPSSMPSPNARSSLGMIAQLGLDRHAALLSSEADMRIGICASRKKAASSSLRMSSSSQDDLVEQPCEVSGSDMENTPLRVASDRKRQASPKSLTGSEISARRSGVTKWSGNSLQTVRFGYRLRSDDPHDAIKGVWARQFTITRPRFQLWITALAYRPLRAPPHQVSH